jgi:hypothetical protein
MMFTCEQLLGRTSTCSHILDSSSADDLRFSPTPGTIPRATETRPSPSMTAFSFPMLARVRRERSTGRWWRMRTRTKRVPPIGGAGARSERFHTQGQALLHRGPSRRRVVGRPRSSSGSQADCILFHYYATLIYPQCGLPDTPACKPQGRGLRTRGRDRPPWSSHRHARPRMRSSHAHQRGRVSIITMDLFVRTSPGSPRWRHSSSRTGECASSGPRAAR